MRLIYSKPEEHCALMKLRKLKAELLYGYLYNTGEKKEKFIPPPVIDRKFKEQDIQKVQMSGAPVVMVAKEEGIVLVRKHQIIKCETNVWTTEYPGVYISKKNIPGAKTINPTEIDLAKYFNAKMDYEAFNGHGSQKALYYDIINRICELKHATLRNKLAIATQHPELAGEVLTGKPGRYGLVAGEVLYFYECRPVFVERRYHDTCTQELAVEWKNESWFMTPFTKKLVPKASPVPCADIVNPQFLIADK